MKKSQLKQIIKECIKEIEDQPIIKLDRFGSDINRPDDVRFDNPEDYNDHMGFDAALPDDLDVPQAQRDTVRKLLKQGFTITGHSKMPDNPKQIEIMMMHKEGSTTRYFDVLPDGKIA